MCEIGISKEDRHMDVKKSIEQLAEASAWNLGRDKTHMASIESCGYVDQAIRINSRTSRSFRSVVCSNEGGLPALIRSKVVYPLYCKQTREFILQ